MKPQQPEKKILKPSVIHDDLPKTSSTSHRLQTNQDDNLPENPERNYHHDEMLPTSEHRAIKRADDDDWNGEDA